MKMLLAGQWVNREKTIEVRDPYDDALIDTVPSATAADVETALAAADAARATARSMTTYERSQILLKTAAIVAENLEDFAVTIAREGSKTIREARGEARRCVNTLTISGEEAKRLLGETIPFDSFPGGENRVGYFYRFPIGVVLAITHPVEGLALYAFLGRSLRSLAALALIHNRGGLLPAVGRVMQVSADEGTVLGSSVYNIPDEDREGDRELDPGWEYLGGFGDVKGEGLSAAPNPFHQEGEHEQ